MRGNYRIENISSQERATVTTSHDSFLQNSEIIEIKPAKQTIQNFTLSRPDNVTNIDTTKDASIDVDGLGIKLPPDAYVDKDGNIVSGKVIISTSYIPVLIDGIPSEIPKDLLAVNNRNEVGILIPKSFVKIELKDEQGNDVELLEGQKIEVSIPAGDGLDHPATVLIWVLDEAKGIWVEYGVANYELSLNTYKLVIQPKVGYPFVPRIFAIPEKPIVEIGTYGETIIFAASLEVCVANTQGNKVSSHLILEPVNKYWKQSSGTSNTGQFLIKSIVPKEYYNIYAANDNGHVGAYVNNPFYLKIGSQKLDECIVLDANNKSENLTVSGKVIGVGDSGLADVDIKIYEDFGNSSSIEIARIKTNETGNFDLNIDFNNPAALDLVLNGSKNIVLKVFAGKEYSIIEKSILLEKGTTQYDVGIVSLTPNIPPVANAGLNRVVYIGQQVQLKAAGSFDPDGLIKEFEWHEGSGEKRLLKKGGYHFSIDNPEVTDILNEYSYIQDELGSHPFVLTITDDRGLRNSDEVIITGVDRPKSELFLDMGPGYFLEKSDVYGFRIWVGDILSIGSKIDYPFKWLYKGEVISEDAWFTLDGENIPDLLKEIGSHVVTLVVTNEAGLSASDELVITISEDTQIVGDIFADAGHDIAAYEGNYVYIRGRTPSYSVNGDLSYRWTEGSTLLSTERGYSTNSLSVGKHIIKLTVTDNKGLTASDKVVVIISVPERAVYADAGLDKVIYAGTKVIIRGESYSRGGKFSGGNPVGREHLTYKWTEGDSILAEGDNQFNPPYLHYEGLVSGLHRIKLTVTHSVTGLSDTDEVIVSVISKDLLDKTPPVITLNGQEEITIIQGTSFVDFGATAVDDRDGIITESILIDNPIKDTFTIGAFVVTYTVKDKSGNETSTTRTVNIIPPVGADTIPSVITLIGENPVTILQGEEYNDAGATVLDNRDGAINYSFSSNVDVATPGSYQFTYTAIDAAGNKATAIRTVIVKPKIDIESPIEITSPNSTSLIEYSFITLEIKDSVSDVTAKNLSLSANASYLGVKNATRYLIYNIVLQKGENKIEISAKDSEGNSVTTELIINSNGKGIPPIALELDQTKAFGSLTTNASVQHSPLVVSEYLIDLNGNKVIDMEVTDIQQLNFPTIGAYHTSVTVRTDDNILYTSSSTYNQTVNILANLEAKSTVITGINAKVYDIEEGSDSIYALTSNAIFKISKDNPTNVETINLPTLNTPEGFAFDRDGNIFIADTGADRVIKLLAANNYQEDTTFILNIGGSDDGQLLSPKDITLSGQGTGFSVYVLDAGNNRVQIFDGTGKYLAKFDGSTTTEGKLNAPLNMIGNSNLLITDAGNNSIREFSYNSHTQKETGEKIASLNNTGKATATESGYFIPDNAKKQLISINAQGEILSKIPMSKTISIGMLYEQNHQLLYQEEGSNQLKHIFIPKTTPENAPLALSKKFVQAYLANDDKTILKFTSARLLRSLKAPEVDVKAQEAFSNLSNYQENIYMYGLKAVVEAKAQTTIGEVSITFDFVWQKGRWLLSTVR